MKFSQRKGFVQVSQVIQKEGMTHDLRSSLWNILDFLVWHRKKFLHDNMFEGPSGMQVLSRMLWHRLFKQPVDTLSRDSMENLQALRKYFFTCEWYEVYDLLEFLLNYFADDDLANAINKVLEAEVSGYRFVSGVFTDIVDAQEIEMLEKTLANHEYPGVADHLRRGLELLSDRKNPDYRNSIKESISGVESLASTHIVGKPKATLSDALAVLKRKATIHPALLEGFTKLYAYTSDEDGIRHAMMEDPNLSSADAKYFLMSCTSFINYMKSKL